MQDAQYPPIQVNFINLLLVPYGQRQYYRLACFPYNLQFLSLKTLALTVER